ncbi:hypothetical protein BBJ28_00008039 [Nothophytophthora sp. Chile5]|nr:hypothetical protein BBJ28_00008039 [Nothophytophthora sp. Chile5]
MSFLLCANDQETLAEALAFIDAYDLGAEDDGNGSALGSSYDEVDTPLGSHKRSRCDRDLEGAADLHVHGKRTQEKNKRRHAVYSARLRAKKKSEKTKLREQVARLQAQLERLSGSAVLSSSFSSQVSSKLQDHHTRLEGHTLAVGGLSASSKSWLDTAVTQAFLRQTSEVQNTRLKALLGKQLRVSETLEGILRKLPELNNELDAMIDTPSPMGLQPSSYRNDATSHLAELRSYTDRMYADAAAVFDACRAGSDRSVYLNSQIQCDPGLGSSFIELSSSTPMACDLDAGSRLIWSGMQLKQGRCRKYCVQRFQVHENAIVKSYLMAVNAHRDSLEFHGVSFARKFEERDRVLYVWTSAIVPPKGKDENAANEEKWWLRFREKGWLMVSRASGNPKHESVFRSCYQVSSETREPLADPPMAAFHNVAPSKDDLDRLCSGVVNGLGSELRSYYQRVQNNLLSEVPVSPRLGRLMMI